MIKVTNDFGHGGTDPGAVKFVVEKDGVLRCGKALTASLIRNGFAVKETRSDDTFVSLDDRVRISDSFGSDWFISNHEDAGGGHGITVYCYKLGGKGEAFANAVLRELVTATGMPSRGVKEGNFEVIRETNCPAILIEFGFVDNADDAAVISRADLPQIYGDAVTKALCSVCDVNFVEVSKPVAERYRVKVNGVQVQLEGEALAIARYKEEISKGKAGDVITLERESDGVVTSEYIISNDEVTQLRAKVAELQGKLDAIRKVVM